MSVFAKDPSSTLDYSFDWSGWLAPGEAITNDTWSIEPADVGVPSLAGETTSGNIASVNVSGGTIGSRYRLNCKIETDLGRTAERSTALRIMEV